MNVADFETGAVAVQTTGPESGETALVGQLGERVDLIHELAQLRTTEEVPHDGGEGLGVDQLRGSHPIEIDVEQGHALLDEALGAGEPDPALVRQQLTDSPDPATAKVIDVIEDPFPATQAEEIGHRDEEVISGDDALVLIHVEGKLLVDLVTTDAGKVVLLRIEEEALEKGAGVRHGRRIARAETAVDVLERLFLVLRGVLPEGLDEEVVVRGGDAGHRLHTERMELRDRRESERLVSLRYDHVPIKDIVEDDLVRELGLVDIGIDLELLDVVELLDNVFVGRVADGAEEGRRKKLAAAAAAIEVNIEEVVRVELHFHPGAAVGDDAETVKGLAIEVQVRLEANAGRTVQLADDDALGAIDDKGATQGHHRQFAHVDALFLRAGLVGEGEGHIERRTEGFSITERLKSGELGLAHLILGKIQGEFLIVALDREDLAENRLQACRDARVGLDILLEEFLVGIELHLDQVGRLDRLLDLAKIHTFKFLGSC